MKIFFFKIPHCLKTSGCRGTFCKVFCELWFGYSQNRFLMQSWRPPEIGIMPKRNHADTFSQPLFSLWTRMWICALACQFGFQLEKSQDILAWVRIYFVFDYLSLEIKKPIPRSFWFHPQRVIKLCLPQSNSNFAKVCLPLLPTD